MNSPSPFLGEGWGEGLSEEPFSHGVVVGTDDKMFKKNASP
jgi:hypothetical protein